jgi:hypothetical protein
MIMPARDLPRSHLEVPRLARSTGRLWNMLVSRSHSVRPGCHAGRGCTRSLVLAGPSCPDRGGNQPSGRSPPGWRLRVQVVTGPASCGRHGRSRSSCGPAPRRFPPGRRRGQDQARGTRRNRCPARNKQALAHRLPRRNEIEVVIVTGATTAKVEANNAAIKHLKRTGRNFGSRSPALAPAASPG